MYRMFNDVQGEYVGIDSDNSEVQTVAFRDGAQLHIILNNLSTDTQAVNLQALLGSANVASATLDRVVWDEVALEGIFDDNLDVTASWQNLSLSGEEGAKLTLTLDSAIDFSASVNEETFYGDDVQVPINLTGATSKIINIAAEIDSAESASIRLSFDRSGILNEFFAVVINGNGILVRPESTGYDDSDTWLVTREIDVPLSYLNEGNNEVYVDFSSSGGQLVTTSLIVTSNLNTPGDFDGDGDVDGADFLAWQRTDGTSTGLAAWRSAYGNSSLLTSSASVPEPTSAMLLLSLAATGLLRRNR